MIHLALWLVSALFVAVVCVVALVGLYALVSSLLRAVAEFATGLTFCVLVVPLWLWHAVRRPMWRTLTADELAALIRGGIKNEP